MKKVSLVILCLIFTALVTAQYRKFSFQQPRMGSLFNLVVYGADSAKAALAARAVYQRIDTLNQIYSDYLPQSELNRLCATSGNAEGMVVSPELFDIIAAACRASALSGGSFDITMGPMIKLWRKARRDKIMPAADSLQAARSVVGYRFIKLDTLNRKIILKKPGMQLDLGGIAKGETAQRAYTRLVELGFPFSLVDAGGDIVAGPVPPGVDGWHVAINMPGSEITMDAPLLLRNKAVTTSGDLYQYVEINGRRYSHIINPFTGMALTNARNVTVISDRGIDADWLTKACSILPVKKALRLIRKFPSTEVQVAVIRKGKPVFFRSPGFAGYFKPD